MKQYKYTINGTKYVVEIGDKSDNIVDVAVNGEAYKVEMEKEKEPEKPHVAHVAPAAAAATAAAAPAQPSTEKKYAVEAPLPGVVTEVLVGVGDEVKDGDTVAVLEAMKMNNNLDTERSGKVLEILVQPGQPVMEGDRLIVIG